MRDRHARAALSCFALIGACSTPPTATDARVAPDAVSDGAHDVPVPDDASPLDGAADVVAPSDASRDTVSYARVLLARDLADPGVLKESDDLFFFSGTRNGRTLPVYRSTDLQSATPMGEYDPSAADPAFDYCNVWAPDLGRHDGLYTVQFSASRVAQGASCPAPGTAVTTFRATAPDAGLAFGAPAPLQAGTAFARTYVPEGCPAEGCDHAVRIDSARFDDGATPWLFYVWFGPAGNSIASTVLGQPAITHNASPMSDSDEGVDEAPFVFARQGRFYLMFSTGFYNRHYALQYLMADSVADLTRTARVTRRHTQPLVAADGRLLETHGHDAVTDRRGRYYDLFHVGEFDAAGQFTGRSTYVQPLVFRDDGSIGTLDTVDVRWSGLDGYRYSLDVTTRDGQHVGPCLAVGLLSDATHAVYGDVCTSAGNRVIHRADIAAFTLYYSNDGTWNAHVDQGYDGFSDRLEIALPGGTPRDVALHWNEKPPGWQYSLDVQRPDGTWVAPCIGVATLGNGIATDFTGACTTAGNRVEPRDVRRFRVCAALHGDWAHATCSEVAYDGQRSFVDVAIP